jgi:FMN phosphatase YigB (HAD superfamily)
MIKAVLLDLDDTLLENDMQVFLQAYLARLGAFMSDRIPSDQFIPHLLRATQQMLENREPARTLQETFAANFYPALDTTEETLRPRLEQFYRSEFPSLHVLTRRRPEASSLVRQLIDAGLQVVVATNPLFPRVAVEERLAWAGLPVDSVPFTLVTSYEHMHSAKPRLAFYAEILGRIGIPPAEAAMIGNDALEDIAPARRLGMAVFHLNEKPEPPFPGGDLTQAGLWLEHAAEETDPEAIKQRDAVLARAHAHLGAVLSMTAGLDRTGWSDRPAPGSWAPVEIVCHMRDAEAEVNLPRLQTILENDNPFLPGASMDEWAQQRGYLGQSPREALEAFVEARQTTLRRLNALDPRQWTRRARHALLGPTDLCEVMAVATEHDLLHLAQLRAAIAAERE